MTNTDINNYNDNPPITLKELTNKILRARSWIIITSFVLFCITLYVSFSTPPVFNATASVIIEKSNTAQKIFNFNMNENIKISDEIAVIKSRTIAEDVVKELWNSNKRNRLYLFGTKIFLPRGQRLRQPLKKILSFGRWSPAQNKAPQYDEEYSYEIGRRYYQGIINSLSVYYKRGTNIIQITASSPNAYEASLIANTVAKIYKKRDKEWSSNESLSLKSFLDQRLKDKEQEISTVELKIEQYKREKKIYDIDGNIANLLNNLTNIESQYNNNNVEINILESQKQYLLNQLTDLESELAKQVLNSINAQLFALRNQVNEKESELVRNATIYGDNHEAVIKNKNSLDILKNKLANKTNQMIAEGLSIVDPIEYRQQILSDLLTHETNLHQLKAQAEQYKLLIMRYKNEIEFLPEKQSYLGKLEREKNVLSNTYAFIRQKMEEARVSMASEPGKVRIINYAVQSSKPVSPDIARNVFMSIIIGALLGFGVNLIKEYFDNRIRSIDFIEKKNLPILAIIPSIESGLLEIKGDLKQKNKLSLLNGKNIDELQRRMVTHEDPKSPISEAYRSLRTSLMYTKNGGHGSIMISSPGPGEGKTTTIINLAITYANLGKKTVLIDGDLRKPVINKVFNKNNDYGLTHYLSEVEKDYRKIIQRSDINNLDVIYNGAIPPNPSELLGSELMVELVNKLKSDYDVILFDAPPIMAVTDAVVLSRLIDQFILVVRFGSTDKDSVNQALTALKNVNTNLTGVVFNDLNNNNSYYSKNYYTYDQYYASS